MLCHFPCLRSNAHSLCHHYTFDTVDCLTQPPLLRSALYGPYSVHTMSFLFGRNRARPSTVDLPKQARDYITKLDGPNGQAKVRREKPEQDLRSPTWLQVRNSSQFRINPIASPPSPRFSEPKFTVPASCSRNFLLTELLRHRLRNWPRLSPR